jgi:hypothetical protein
MQRLSEIAPAFVEMAHRIVWCSAASVDLEGRPRSRVLHPLWEWDGQRLVGWIATSPLSPKRAQLDAHPYVSLNYWEASQDTCLAECEISWVLDLPGREALWQRFLKAPAPVGYDPKIIPPWTSPAAEAFGGLRLEPWSLRLMDGSLMLKGKGRQLSWRRS